MTYLLDFTICVGRRVLVETPEYKSLIRRGHDVTLTLHVSVRRGKKWLRPLAVFNSRGDY